MAALARAEGGAEGGDGPGIGSSVPQYAALHFLGAGSLYEYVVVAPSSYEQAHTCTGVSMKQSWKGPASLSKHTLPGVGGWPAAGCGVARQPAIWLPPLRHPGATLGMR